MWYSAAEVASLNANSQFMGHWLVVEEGKEVVCGLFGHVWPRLIGRTADVWKDDTISES